MAALTEQQIQRLIDRWAEYTNRADFDWDQLFVIFENMWAGLETYLGYDLLSTSQSEVFTKPCSSDKIVLTHPNVTAVGFVSATTDDAFTTRYTGSDTNARVEVTDAAVVTTSRVGVTSTATTSTFAANVQTSDMVSTVHALSGWEATLRKTYPSAYLYRAGSRWAKDAWVDVQYWEEFDGDFVVEYSEGIVTFQYGWNVFGPQIRIDYTAGLTAIPSDLEGWLIQQGLTLYDSSTQDQSLVRERLGDYEYERPRPSEMADLAARIDFGSSAVVSRYRRLLP